MWGPWLKRLTVAPLIVPLIRPTRTLGPRMSGLGDAMIGIGLGVKRFDCVRPERLGLLDREFDLSDRRSPAW